MATPRKKPVRKPRTVVNEEYTELEMYAIWLHEFYQTLIKAGFKSEVAMALIMDKDSFPDWAKHGNITEADVQKFIEDEDD